MRILLKILSFAAIFSLGLTAGFAQTALIQPKGEVILSVSGEIGAKNADGLARFDRSMLEAMPVSAIRTSTIWTNGIQEFQGVSLKTLLERLGVDRGMLQAKAINDYAVDIPVSDAVEDGPIIAYNLKGRPMSIRDKGPLWIVYPYDAKPEYQTEVIYSRSIWQLDRIVVSGGLTQAIDE